MGTANFCSGRTVTHGNGRPSAVLMISRVGSSVAVALGVAEGDAVGRSAAEGDADGIGITVCAGMAGKVGDNVGGILALTMGEPVEQLVTTKLKRKERVIKADWFF